MKNIKKFPPYTLLLTYSGMLLFYLGGAASFDSALRLTLLKSAPWIAQFGWIIFLSGVILLAINLFRIRAHGLKRKSSEAELPH
jgi:hypothetical protein